MTDYSRALEQIAEIHEQLAKTEVYRGWRSLPVACSALIGFFAAAWPSAPGSRADAWGFTVYWLGVGVVALIVGCSEIVWRYAVRATPAERRRSRQVVGQFLPALVAGAAATGAVVRLDPALISLLPGFWALLFGVAIFAARPFVPRASGWVGLYYWTAGLVLLWRAPDAPFVSPWAIGGTFGVGQLFAAAALYWSIERPDRMRARAERAEDDRGEDHGEKA
ncbi:MAG TPA: hypothetical protein VLT86_18305 [Vicinamibacterales bacterium]|nr:hypothetical protein [Vicinamibacterales bacterium]